ncbi:neutral/alkaline non-lysosomal ceramidase [Colletotrichum fioriniae PJ7]|uniref:ceramidase n=1 Tax=Colletotrichum fioriniae PJ7 TaxID=1445577 RepID=A0A010SBD2_9PEZI|nr:neutral/alkaline non-lysosomal ceramidase [Colletotrichum fioriniae PJ7]
MPRHSRSGLEMPRRSFFAVFALISFVLLVTVSLSQLGTRQGATLKFERNADGEWHAKPKTRAAAGDKYLLGVGKADITGPVVEIGFAGYADLSQVGTGLRQRIYSRAFIVGDVSKPSDRFVYLVLDTQSGDTAIRKGILEGVAALGSGYSVYNKNNVAVTGTHSHAGPGAWFNYLLPQVTSLGFDKQSYQAIVDGAVLSIKRAHESLQEGYLDVGTTEVTDGAINRSLYAYLNNPAAERAKYSATTDTTLTLLRFQRASDGKNMGVLTWYPTHGTSILQNSTHVAGDNKGVAAYLLEKDLASDASAAPGFVAGFSQANVGDTTPNVLGAYCDDGSGQQCSLENSTCADGKSQSCHGRGPAFQKLDLGISSCYEIGRRQYAGAKSVYNALATTSTPVTGTSVKSFHFFQDMSYFKFPLADGTIGQTCPAALGYSFAAGTSDGPGAFDFTQADSGTPDANPLWAVVSGLLRTPSAEQAACQQPKPVLLDVGEMSTPYAWSPNIVDIQMLRVGQLVIVVAPGEATTMSGRRWKAAVKEAAKSILPNDPIVVLGGPANTYAHYIATPEEYAIQRYEGASTLFGPNTLPAYINLTVSNIAYLSPSSTSTPAVGPSPPDNRANSLSFITGVVVDGAPAGRSFGQAIGQPSSSYTRGAVVNATFQAANPRNNLRLEGTYAAVEQLQSGKWVQIRTDADWFLVYTWTRTNFLLGYTLSKLHAQDMDHEESQDCDSSRNADFCKECWNAIIFDDSADEFFEGTNQADQPTLRHSREGGDMVELDSVRCWDDTLPDLPMMAESAAAGCRMCGFLREELIRREISYDDDVYISAVYLYGGLPDLEVVFPTEYGLAFWRCSVFTMEEGHLVAALNFGIETNDDALRQWLRLGLKRAPEPLDPQNVEWLQSELWDCEDACGHPEPASPFLPTRLLDMGKSDEEIPRLVVVEDMLNSREIDHVRYATLSYCWGPEDDTLQQAKTTKATMSAHLKGIPLSSMSPVVRDTVRVCRALGIQYLWVDALCIIQEDKADWDRESHMMGKVYYSCLVTICPVSSRSCIQGYLGPRPQGLDVAFQSSHHEHIRGTYTLVHSSTDVDENDDRWPRPGPLKVDLNRSSWEKRGWTFQERLLSPRLIMFGSSMSYFACETVAKSETGYQVTDILQMSLRSTLEKAFGEVGDEMNHSAKSINGLYDIWDGTVINITTKIWTFPEDTFAGIAGLAQGFATITGDTYLAGLWKNQLHQQLLWEGSRPKTSDLPSFVHNLQHPDPYIAPSWSWASQKIYVEEFCQPHYTAPSGSEVAASASPRKETQPSHNCPEVSLIDHRMDFQGRNPFGPLSGAYLQLKGKTCPFPSDVERQAVRRHEDVRLSYSQFSGGIGTCKFDWAVSERSAQRPERMQLLCLSSCCSATTNWKHMKWLADCDDEDFDDWMPSDAEVGGMSFPNGYEDIDMCRYCADPMHKRTGYGLVIHPAEEPGSYVRVGAFVLFAHKGGMDLFKDEAKEIKLI